MNIKKAAAMRLLAVPELAAIVGDRVYRQRLPQTMEIRPPHIIIWMLNKDRLRDHDGYAYTEATLQISCFSRDPDEADTMGAIVCRSMETWAQEDSDVMDVTFESADDIFEEATLIYHIAGDYKVSYHED